MITIDPPIEELTFRQRVELIEELESSLPETFDPFSDDIMQMLQERRAAAERGENKAIPIEEAFERLMSRYK